ncbi:MULTISPECIES: hypothetical protein [Burkholderiaceae]|uniref:hypothetical protein n=1 Tax=Burkholderiaceae TaxID=119060 RepID=UPI0016184B51|nr:MULTISPECIES: hypothetical protein [Burkholderiaceae]MBB2981375.1 hypothetical protein [Paraburkholderia tropica]
MHTPTNPVLDMLDVLFIQAGIPLLIVAGIIGAAYLGLVLGTRRNTSRPLPPELDQEEQPTYLIRPARPTYTQAEAGQRLRATIASFNAARQARTTD